MGWVEDYINAVRSGSFEKYATGDWSRSFDDTHKWTGESPLRKLWLGEYSKEKLKSIESVSLWIKANKPTDIEFEMIDYNTLIVKPNKQEIVKYGLQ